MLELELKFVSCVQPWYGMSCTHFVIDIKMLVLIDKLY